MVFEKLCTPVTNIQDSSTERNGLIRNPFSESTLLESSYSDTSCRKSRDEWFTTTHVSNPFSPGTDGSNGEIVLDSPHSQGTILSLGGTSQSQHSSFGTLSNYHKLLDHRESSDEKDLIRVMFDKCKEIRAHSRSVSQLSDSQRDIQTKHNMTIEGIKKKCNSVKKRNEGHIKDIDYMRSVYENIPSFQIKSEQIRQKNKTLIHSISEKEQALVTRKYEVENSLGSCRKWIENWNNRLEFLTKRKTTLYEENSERMKPMVCCSEELERVSRERLSYQGTSKDLRSAVILETEQVQEKEEICRTNKRNILESMERLRKVKALNDRLQLLEQHIQKALHFTPVQTLRMQECYKNVKLCHESAYKGINDLCNKTAERVRTCNVLILRFQQEAKKKNLQAQFCLSNSSAWRKSIFDILDNLKTHQCTVDCLCSGQSELSLQHLQNGRKIFHSNPCSSVQTQGFTEAHSFPLQDMSMYNNESVWVVQEARNGGSDEHNSSLASVSISGEPIVNDLGSKSGWEKEDLPALLHNSLSDAEVETPSRDMSVAFLDSEYLLPPSPHRLPNVKESLEDFSVRFI